MLPYIVKSNVRAGALCNIAYGRHMLVLIVVILRSMKERSTHDDIRECEKQELDHIKRSTFEYVVLLRP